MSKVVFGNTELETLVAITESEKARGLMGKSWPPPVMAFPCEASQVCKFWMKDTPSPLDIIFCYAGKVTAIEKGVPYSEEHVGPDELTDLVVELPFGTAEKLGIAPGTPVRLVLGLAELGRKIELNLAKPSR